METLPIQVRFGDVDSFQHVNNCSILAYYELGRVDFMEKVLGKGFHALDETVVMVYVDLDFCAQIRLEDSIAVTTRVEHIGNKSIKTYQEIVNTLDGSVYSRSRCVLSGFSKKENASLVIKDAWRVALEKTMVSSEV